MRKFSVFVRMRTALSFAVLMALFAVAPCTLATAQSSAAAPATSQAAAGQDNTAVEVTPKNEKREEDAFLYAPVVQSIAKKLNMSVETTSDIFQGINFAVLFLAIAIPLFRLLPRVLQRRSQMLRHKIDEARKVTEDANTRLAAMESRLSGLDKEIAALRAQVEQESQQDEIRIKASLAEESARIVASAEQEIDAAASHARRSLQSYAADLAIDQATRQLVLSPETDKALIAEFIGSIAPNGGKQGGQN